MQRIGQSKGRYVSRMDHRHSTGRPRTVLPNAAALWPTGLLVEPSGTQAHIDAMELRRPEGSVPLALRTNNRSPGNRRPLVADVSR